MKLSQKQKIFPEFFFRFVNLDTILNIFKKNDESTLIADVFLTLRSLKHVVR